MKLEQALEMGHEMGLSTPAECVNNIIYSAVLIWPYQAIRQETDELIEDAKNNGVNFSEICGHAIEHPLFTNLPCTSCEKLMALERGIK